MSDSRPDANPSVSGDPFPSEHVFARSPTGLDEIPPTTVPSALVNRVEVEPSNPLGAKNAISSLFSRVP